MLWISRFGQLIYGCTHAHPAGQLVRIFPQRRSRQVISALIIADFFLNLKRNREEKCENCNVDKASDLRFQKAEVGCPEPQQKITIWTERGEKRISGVDGTSPCEADGKSSGGADGRTQERGTMNFPSPGSTVRVTRPPLPARTSGAPVNPSPP